MRADARYMVATLVLVVVVVVGALATSPGNDARTVLLVHGYRGAPTALAALQVSLRARGIPSIQVALPGEDNVVNAQAIREAVDRIVRVHGSGTRVDIVAHSMGGLSSRWFARFLSGSPADGPPLVANYVALGTPQYGLAATCNLAPDSGGQMCPSSEFLTLLNAGDDTPGGTAYTTIYSPADGLVPTASSRLDGGACFVEVADVNHFALRTDAIVLDLIVEALRGRCPGVLQ